MNQAVAGRFSGPQAVKLWQSYDFLWNLSRSQNGTPP